MVSIRQLLIASCLAHFGFYPFSFGMSFWKRKKNDSKKNAVEKDAGPFYQTPTPESPIIETNGLDPVITDFGLELSDNKDDLKDTGTSTS
ncbi:hypothetical protein QTP86_032358 [Hemibagrus guttatus]|nr:hypothetical protein QTP86_032358 [Hemibagrus guttatus]